MKKLTTKRFMRKMHLSQFVDRDGFKKEKENIDLLPNQTGTEEDLRVFTPEEIEESLEDNFEEAVPVAQPGVMPEVVEDIEEYEETPEAQEFEEIPEFDNSFDAVEWADTNNQTMRIHYVTLRGKHLVRDIEPHASHYSSDTHRSVVVTWDDTVSDIRSFVIENILEFEFLGKKFTPKFFFAKRGRYVNVPDKIRHK